VDNTYMGDTSGNVLNATFLLACADGCIQIPVSSCIQAAAACGYTVTRGDRK
jgi:hypothetical protein